MDLTKATDQGLERVLDNIVKAQSALLPVREAKEILPIEVFKAAGHTVAEAIVTELERRGRADLIERYRDKLRRA